jgi:outer membrane protein
MSRWLAPALFAAGLLSGGERLATAEGSMRVAVVDVQHAVMATEDGIRAQTDLKKTFDKRQQELNNRQNELQATKVDIEKQAGVLSREALQKRMEDWQKRMLDLQQVFLDYNKELQTKQADKTQPIIKKMITIIGNVAKKNGYDMVVDKQAVPFARSDLDLTDQVVQMYNSGDSGGGDSGDDKKKK